MRVRESVRERVKLNGEQFVESGIFSHKLAELTLFVRPI